MVKSIPIHVVSVAHTGYLRAGVRLDAGVNEITVSPGQLAAMEADPRLVVTVLAAPDHIDADDDAKFQSTRPRGARLPSCKGRSSLP